MNQVMPEHGPVAWLGGKTKAFRQPDEDIGELVNGLFEIGIETVVIKQGEKGASAYTKDGIVQQSAFQIEAIDTTGAGDSFDAGFMAAVLRNMPLEQAMKYACATAAIKVSRIGARAVPTHKEIVEFLG